MFKRSWSQFRQHAQHWWDQLTDADLEQVAGQKDRLVRALEIRYGYVRERAEQEVERHLGEFYQSQDSPQGGVRESVSSAAQQFTSALTQTASEAGNRAQKLVSTAATTVGNTAARAGRYLPEIPRGIGDSIRQYPLPSLALALGLGFLLGRSCAGVSGTDAADESMDQSVVGFPNALIQCPQCGQMLRQADMVEHSTACRGSGISSHGGSTS
jgi:hypothetical protein